MAIYSKNIEGLDELIEAFVQLPEECVMYIEEASVEPAKKILIKARENVSKYNKYSDTGALKKSLKVSKPSKRRKYKYQVFSKVYFGKGGAHGVPLELGHRLIINEKDVGAVKEHPFLRPAADESKDDVINAMVTAMNKALEEMGGLK